MALRIRGVLAAAGREMRAELVGWLSRYETGRPNARMMRAHIARVDFDVFVCVFDLGYACRHGFHHDQSIHQETQKNV